MNATTSDQLVILLNGCKKEERESQKQLYRLFYGYAMSICIRYAKNSEEAMEVLNDGFLKVFTYVKRYEPEKYDPVRSFKGWLRKILINTALDHYRSNLRHANHQSLPAEASTQVASGENALTNLAYEDLVAMIQQLSPVYRTVFNLYVIDGYSHEEIAEKLGISTGTSKSNLSKARANLREMVKKTDKDAYARNVG